MRTQLTFIVSVALLKRVLNTFFASVLSIVEEFTAMPDSSIVHFVMQHHRFGLLSGHSATHLSLISVLNNDGIAQHSSNLYFATFGSFSQFRSVVDATNGVQD